MRLYFTTESDYLSQVLYLPFWNYETYFYVNIYAFVCCNILVYQAYEELYKFLLSMSYKRGKVRNLYVD